MNSKSTLKYHLAIVELGYGCGLRASELCGLEVVDLDFDSRLLRTLGKGNKTQ